MHASKRHARAIRDRYAHTPTRKQVREEEYEQDNEECGEYGGGGRDDDARQRHSFARLTGRANLLARNDTTDNPRRPENEGGH